MKIENYYLDLKAVQALDLQEREVIHGYYKEMLYSFQEGRDGMCRSIMNTLIKGGYLIDSRDEKLEDILDGD